MTTADLPVTSTGAELPLAPLSLPPGVVIHMIAFAGFPEACDFVADMAAFVNSYGRPGHVLAYPTIVTTKERFIWAAQAQTAVMLVSAHGPATAKLAPVVGDGNWINRVTLRSLDQKEPFEFGARAATIWDACFAGQPAFRSELTRLSAPGVVHVGPTGKTDWEGSWAVVTAILRNLLAEGSSAITADSFATAAAKAAASGGMRSWLGPGA
jgi:hypothetical protein